MAKAATPLTVTVTAKLVEKDRGSPPEIKKEEKYCYVRIQSAENYRTVIVFQVDEILTVNLVSIFRLKGNECLVKSQKNWRSDLDILVSRLNGLIAVVVEALVPNCAVFRAKL